MVYVSATAGIVDALKLKAPVSVSWPSGHGEVVDLDNPVFEPRDIVLTCFIKATGNADFLVKVNTFMQLFRNAGTHRLLITLDDSFVHSASFGVNIPKPLIYEVYCTDTAAVTKTWSESTLTGTFQLKLREPDPVKIVAAFIIDDVPDHSGNWFKINNVTQPLTVYWGDGTVSKDIQPTIYNDATMAHTYDSYQLLDLDINGIYVYYAIITGGIRADTTIQLLRENLQVLLWNRL